MYELLKDDVVMRNSFVLNRKLLNQFRLAQLILSTNHSEIELGLDFSLLLFRTDKHTVLDDILQDP